MDVEQQLPERRRPPSWVSKWKDPGIVLIVLGLCVTTGKQMERMDDMDQQTTQLTQINAQLSTTVTELATQMTTLTGQVASMPQITTASNKLEARMDATETRDREFRDDLKAWMVRVETKIDREASASGRDRANR